MANNQKERGSVAFFSTYRPPVPLDLYWSRISPKSSKDTSVITDGISYNYNGREIPPGALKTLLNYTRMGQSASFSDIDNGKVRGFVFVSERTNNLETLHFALRSENVKDSQKTKVYNFAQLYNTTFRGVRMEDSGCFAGNRYFIYASTMERNPKRRQPWTAVYRTDLCNGQTIRLTPKGEVDFSPSVSPSGSKIAVASLQLSGGWSGEIEDLKTDIYVMNVTWPFCRMVVIKNGGWPSWGSDNILYFHYATRRPGPDGKTYCNWGVFRSQIREGSITTSSYRMTPTDVDAMTPAAIDDNRVAVAIIRKKLDLNHPRSHPFHYRHIEVFDLRSPNKPFAVTPIINPKADHFNPFVITTGCDDDQVLIGFNCCINRQLKKGDVTDNFDRLQTKLCDQVEVFRVPGAFPTFTSDGQKLAFVDNDFKHVYLADSQGGLRNIFSVSDLKLPEGADNVFSPVWSQNPQRDELFICVGPPFSATNEVHIYIIYNASTKNRRWYRLTSCGNNAFPSTDPTGTKFVYRSTRAWVGKVYKSPIRPKNLYIYRRAMEGVKPTIARLTNGDWIDTHCQWSPNGQWIVFSSTRDKLLNAPRLDNGLDPGYYSIYLMKANDTTVVVRVVRSGIYGEGHVNHPMFSPDGNSIIFAADLAGVSVEPISLPLFLHSVRPYGDIFSVDINKNDILANKDLMEYNRVTHSRYENSTPNWSIFTTLNWRGAWKGLSNDFHTATWHCPFANGAQTWESTGHLGLSKRCC